MVSYQVIRVAAVGLLETDYLLTSSLYTHARMCAPWRCPCYAHKLTYLHCNHGICSILSDIKDYPGHDLGTNISKQPVLAS